MKKIEAIIRPAKLDILIDRLEDIGISGMNIFEVRGYGSQKGHEEMYRGVTYRIRLREKIRVELVINDDLVDKVVKTIVETAKTGSVGDGKIFITAIEDAVRIRTGEKGEKAL
ncbi:P-II family nitrogen regulator [Iocasia frigidifontis]|uniref:P-II family nitrogen regulator n=1 Tax=Iocasia fonsfrigidae TaxID=2682810 RepID=A0A8A7KGK7_9FIRM|nr:MULTISPECIES: P-II family nitrogen regulator [Halanaerobiaceae]AZO94095.1 P-II family nitrogen regulator [Halocella sp. SP3-1]QTL97012.1 P-II family nitrogen regulator [Iocasia fonsfrigidae]